MNECKNDVEDIMLPANNQGQQLEQGVQITYHCTGSVLNEPFTYAFVVVKPFNNQKVKMQHTEKLNTRFIRPNQHIKKD